jgi:hypothetical protein
MNLTKLRAVAAVLSYAVIVSLAVFNLHDPLLGKGMGSAHMNSSPPVAAQSQEPAASNPANSGPTTAPETPAQATTRSEPSVKGTGTSSGSPAHQTKPASAQASQSSIPVAGNGSITVGERLPNFFLVGLNGNTLNESALHGHKTLFIIVNPQCPHCQKELRLLHQIESDYPAIEPMFASVSPVDQTWPLAQMTGEGDHLYAGAMELATDIGIKHVPFLMLIDEKGVVRWIKEGEMDETNFRDILGKFGRGETVTQLPSAKTPTASSFGEPA